MSEKNWSIAENAVKVRVCIGMYPGRKAYHSLAAEIAAAKGADSKRLETYVMTIDKKMVQAIQKMTDKARKYLRSQTTVWDDCGWKLCPSAKVAEVTAEMAKLKNEWRDLVQTTIIDKYEDIVKIGKEEIGEEIWSGIGFPSVEDLKKRYKFQFEKHQIQDAKECQLKIRHFSELEQAAFEEEMRERFGQQLRSTVEQIIERCLSEVRYVQQTLADSEKRFETATIGKKIEILKDLKSMNVMEDELIDTAINNAIEALSKINPELVRASEEERSAAANNLLEIEKDIEEIEGTFEGTARRRTDGVE